MPNSHNTFKAQSITTTTTTTTVSSTSSKLITTNAVLPSRVSEIFTIYVFVLLLFLYLINFQPSIANTTNIDTLLASTEPDEKIIAPAENVQDKIAFIFNNLSQVNLQTKVKYFLEITYIFILSYSKYVL